MSNDPNASSPHPSSTQSTNNASEDLVVQGFKNRYIGARHEELLNLEVSGEYFKHTFNRCMFDTLGTIASTRSAVIQSENVYEDGSHHDSEYINGSQTNVSIETQAEYTNGSVRQEITNIETGKITDKLSRFIRSEARFQRNSPSPVKRSYNRGPSRKSH